MSRKSNRLKSRVRWLEASVAYHQNETRKAIFVNNCKVRQYEEMLKSRATLTIDLKEVSEGILRHGRLYALQVQFTPEAFEHNFYKSREIGMDASYYAHQIGREVSEKVERAIVDFIAGRKL